LEITQKALITGAVNMKNTTARKIVARIVAARRKLPLYSLIFFVIYSIFTRNLMFVNLNA
jgi:hypothetical protein